MALAPGTDRMDTPPDLLTTEIAGAIQGLGTPAEVFAANTGSNPLVPISRYETAEIGRNTWEISESFIEGFEPYPEYCEFITGQFRMIPLFFGLQPAEVVEESCQCRGDAACVFRVSWDEGGRGHGIRRVPRGAGPEPRGASRAAPGHDHRSGPERALRGRPPGDRREHHGGRAGRGCRAGARTPCRLPREGLLPRPHSWRSRRDRRGRCWPGGSTIRPILSAPVTSGRRHYGVLAVGEHGGLFASQAQATLDTHARLAAATLDAADALEEARHQATTAEALLGLSTSLAEIVSLEEMATKVVRAVPDVIDCDRCRPPAGPWGLARSRLRGVPADGLLRVFRGRRRAHPGPPLQRRGGRSARRLRPRGAHLRATSTPRPRCPSRRRSAWPAPPSASSWPASRPSQSG